MAAGSSLTDLLQDALRQRAAHLHRACATLFQRGIVEKSVRIRVQYLVRELRRHGRVHGYRLDLAIADLAQHGGQPVDIHRLGEHVFHHLVHQRMVRNLNIALDVLEASRHVGEDRGQKIVGSHALDLRRNLLASLEAQQGERAVGVPAPARLKDGRAGEHRLCKHVSHGLRLEEVKDVGERKAVLLGERDVDAIVRG